MMDPLPVSSAADPEPQRLDVLRSYGVIGTPPDERFDRITRLATDLLGAPFAFIVLVDEARVYFKTRAGEAPAEIPRAVSFGAHVIEAGRPLVVEDATLDERLAGHPMVVGAPYLRFFAGVPLEAPSGHRLGALAVVDPEPRTVTDRELAQLNTLAALVVDELELSRHARALQARTEALERAQDHARQALDAVKSGFFAVDTDWRVTQMNLAAEALLQHRRDELVGQNLWEAFPEAVPMAFYEEYHRAVRDRVSVAFEALYEPFGVWYEVRAYPFEGGLSVYFDDVTERRRVEEERERWFRGLADNSPDVIARYGLDLRMLYANPAIERATGFERGFLIGKRADELPIPEALARKQDTWLREVIRTGQSLRRAFSFKTPSGLRHFDALTVPERDASGQVVSVLSSTRDVTAEQEAVEAQRRSEERYRALVEATASIVWRISADGHSHLDLIGGALVEEAGDDASKINARNWLTFVHPDDRAGTERDWADAVARGDRYETEYRGLMSDGSVRWFAVRAVPVRDEHGVVQEWVGTSTDVTERKRAQEALLESEARFRSLVQHSNEVVTLLDRNGKVLYVSDSLERLAGYRPEDWIGRDGSEFTHPEDVPYVVEALQATIGGQGGRCIEYRYRDAWDAWRWVESQVTNLLDNPAVGALVLNSRDITERVEARAALVASEVKHRALVEQAGHLVYEHDIETGHLVWSGHVEAVTGETPEAFADVDFTAWSARIHPDDRDRVAAQFEEAVEAGTSFEISYRFAHADGTYRHIEDRGTFLVGLSGRATVAVGMMEDVTERKERERALRQSESRYRALSHLVQTFAYGYEVPDDGSRPTLAWITGSVEEVLGRPPDDFGGLPWGGHVSEEDQETTEVRMRAALDGESRVDDVRMLDAQGRPRWIRLVSQPEVDPETGRVVRIYGAGQNVTAQKAAEAELIAAREHAERLQAEAEAASEALQAALREQQLILDSSLDVICQFDAEGRFVSASAAAAQVWGYEPEELLGRRYFDLVHPDDVPKTRDSADAIMAGVKVYDFRNRYVRKDGSVVPMVWSAVWSEEDQRMLGVARDRSEAEAQERRVQVERERLRLISEATSDVLWDWDLRTDEVWWGTGIQTFFGHTEQDISTGIAFWEHHIHPDDRGDIVAGLHAALKAGESSWSGEYRFLKADGTPVPVLDRGRTLFDEHGKAVRMVGGLMDVTAPKAAAAALVEAKERAEEMARLKDAFLANMSHEIRTPLTSILGFTEILHDEVDDRHQEIVAMIQAGGQRLKDTLTSVLELSQLQANRVAVGRATVELGPLVAETVSLMQPQARRKGLALSWASDSAVRPIVGDRTAIGRVLANLIGNALKFTDRGAIRVSLTQTGEQVALGVADTGKGIAPEFLPHLFDEFRQESVGLNRSHEGAGLGLAITKRLVDLMGGTIAVESERGQGAVFTVLLPAVDDAEPARPASGAGTDGGARRRVLLVEDAEHTRIFVERALARTHEVVSAANSREALEAAGGPSLDVVLLDINLGEDPITGDVLLGMLKALPACQGAAFVAMTAYALPGDHERFLAAGFDRYLPKPFTRAELKAALVPVQS